MSEALKAAFASQPQDLKAVETIKTLCEEAKSMEAQITALEEALNAAQKSHREIVETKIPDALGVLRMKNFTLDDGTVVKLTEAFYGSLPKDPEKRQIALKKLREEYEGGAIIKQDVKASFPGTQANLARHAFELLKSEGVEDLSLEEGVHPMTLASFARQRMEAGLDTDLAALGVYQQRVAKFTIPKPKAPRKTKSKKAEL